MDDEKDYEGRCPFCNGSFSALVSIGAVTHSLPTCSTFDRLDALTFVMTARRKIVGIIPSLDSGEKN